MNRNKRGRRKAKNLPPDSSDEDEPLSNLAKTAPRQPPKPSNNEDSSSESDIETYLQPADKIDLDSPFFSLQKESDPFDKIENDILAGVSRLSDSESEDEPQVAPQPSKLNFNQLHEYTKKMEDAKRQVEEYNARQRLKDKEMDIQNLLAAGESKSLENVENFENNLHSSDFESCSDSEKEGWEEVEEKQKEKTVPKEGLEIRVEMPNAVRKKKGVDLMAAIKRRINRVRKENQVLIHRVHLLCWIAHGNYICSRINSESVLSVALSLLPSQHCYPSDRTDLKYLEQILKWFRSAITNVEKDVPEGKNLEELLESQITKKEAFNKKMLVYIFVAILRSLGIQCRLVLSFQVEPLRPPSSELHSLSTKNDKASTSKDKEKKIRAKSVNEEPKEKETKRRSKSSSEITNGVDKSKPRSSTSREVESKASKSKNEPSEVKSDKSKSTRSKSTSDNKEKTNTRSKSTTELPKKKEKPKTNIRSKSTTEVAKKNKEEENKKDSKPKLKPQEKSKKSPIIKIKLPEPKNTKTSKINKDSEIRKEAPSRRLRSQRDTLTVPQVDGANDSPPKPNLRKLKKKEPPCPIKAHPKRLKAVTKYKDSDSEDDFASTRSPFSSKNDSPQASTANLRKLRPKNDVRNDVINLVKKSLREQKDLIRSKTVKKRRSRESDDSDFAPEVMVKKRRSSEDDFSPKIPVKRRVQVKKDGEDEKIKKKHGVDVWAEVFLESEEKWISVDVVKGQVHCVNELYTRASHPVSYIVGWNNDGTIKDITRRYCTNFNTVTRKLRIDQKWWEESLKPFKGRKTARDREEDDELERQQLEKPLPTSISEYKNHPLYILKRHLLKFEALYPADAPTLGFVRNEPVYSRQCVYVLHSRDLWLKHARVVKPGEQPYKIVKARPKWDKLSNTVITDQLLEVFGIWQTQEYEPPTAENGVVPRNAFGNVELFKPCMLPKKTVHLQLPGLNKVARRMNIDCAPALVGFDFHGGWNHPTYDGFIVCEEFADVLVAAWDIDQEEQEKKEQEKIDKRVYGNWKRLIRGLLIRERLKARYDFGEPSGSGGKKKAKGLPKLATKKRKVESESD